MKDEEEFLLRDKFAIEILAALLTKTSIAETISNKDDDEIGKLKFTNSTRLVRYSYKLADVMRKVRLGAFD